MQIVIFTLFLKHKHKIVRVLRKAEAKTSLTIIEHVSLLIYYLLCQCAFGHATNHQLVLHLKFGVNLQNLEMKLAGMIRQHHLNL